MRGTTCIWLLCPGWCLPSIQCHGQVCESSLPLGALGGAVAGFLSATIDVLVFGAFWTARLIPSLVHLGTTNTDECRLAIPWWCLAILCEQCIVARSVEDLALFRHAVVVACVEESWLVQSFCIAGHRSEIDAIDSDIKLYFGIVLRIRQPTHGIDQTIVLPGRYVTLKLYPWICSNILCRSGGAACIGFAQIVSRGFWSLITVNGLAYRYVWYRFIPFTTASISRSMLLACRSVLVRLPVLSGKHRLRALLGSPVIVLEAGFFVDQLLQCFETGLLVGVPVQGTSSFTRLRSTCVLSASCGMNGLR